VEIRLEDQHLKPASHHPQGKTFAASTNLRARLSLISLLSLVNIHTVSQRPVGVGNIKLSDGAHLRLRILIVDVKEIGFSPFGGVNFYANVTGGVYVEFIPDRLRELVKAAIPKPRACQRRLGVARHRRTKARRGAGDCSELAGRIRGEGCSRRVARNTHYRSPTNEPIYWVHWLYKVSWKPKK